MSKKIGRVFDLILKTDHADARGAFKYVHEYTLHNRHIHTGKKS